VSAVRRLLLAPTGHLLPRAAPAAAAATRWSHGLVDRDLSHKLAQESKFEQKANDSTAVEPDFLKRFRQVNLFQIHDTPGRDEVVLTRTFGNEQIRVTFSVDDINNLQDDEVLDEEEEEEEDEEAVLDEDGDKSREGEVEEAMEEEEEVDVDESASELQNYPVHASVTISKSNSAIGFDLVMEEGEIGYESIVVYDSPSVATDDTPQADLQRRNVYGGPQFGHIDDEVQTLVERYLEERGVDTLLASFIPNYIEYKEQREYMHWLKQFKAFVDE